MKKLKTRSLTPSQAPKQLYTKSHTDVRNPTKWRVRDISCIWQKRAVVPEQRAYQTHEPEDLGMRRQQAYPVLNRY
ncbi:MAG TPA: hypothetical protein PKZ19_14455, partial [Zoogloea sp.]|nr:hypothetical protein [Zoogloea sp.]